MKGPKGIFRGESSFKDERFVCTGEKRPPKKGEYFLSGAIVTAYKAHGDIDTEHWIARKVKMVKCACCNGYGEVAEL